MQDTLHCQLCVSKACVPHIFISIMVSMEWSRTSHYLDHPLFVKTVKRTHVKAVWIQPDRKAALSSSPAKRAWKMMEQSQSDSRAMQTETVNRLETWSTRTQGKRSKHIKSMQIQSVDQTRQIVEIDLKSQLPWLPFPGSQILSFIGKMLVPLGWYPSCLTPQGAL